MSFYDPKLEKRRESEAWSPSLVAQNTILNLKRTHIFTHTHTCIARKI